MPFPTDQVLFLLALVDLRQARFPLRRRHSESQHFKSLSECKLYGFWSLFCVIRARTSKTSGADVVRRVTSGVCHQSRIKRIENPNRGKFSKTVVDN